MEERSCNNAVRLTCVETFTASQLGNVLVLFFILWSFISTTYTDTGFISVSANLSVLLNIFYFIVGSWIVEEKYIYELRTLPRHWKNIEFFIRLLALMALPLFLDHKEPLLPGVENNFPINIGIMLITLSVLYFIWDWIIYLSTNKVPSIVHADFFAILASCSWVFVGIYKNHLAKDSYGSFLTYISLIFLIPMVILCVQEWESIKDFGKRLSRERVR